MSKVPVDRQRLIFRGKQLKDNDTVKTYKISNFDVIHLVAKTTIEVIYQMGGIIMEKQLLKQIQKIRLKQKVII